MMGVVVNNEKSGNIEMKTCKNDKGRYYYILQNFYYVNGQRRSNHMTLLEGDLKHLRCVVHKAMIYPKQGIVSVYND